MDKISLGTESSCVPREKEGFGNRLDAQPRSQGFPSQGKGPRNEAVRGHKSEEVSDPLVPSE